MSRTTRWETEALRARYGRRSEPVVDVREHAPEASVTPPQAGVAQPGEGTLLVPLDAWRRMLDQLGNLHEAGQQLAEARERAAKAETEAAFLRERLAELRSRLAEHSDEPVAPAAPEPAPPTPPHHGIVERAGSLVRSWRSRSSAQ